MTPNLAFWLFAFILTSIVLALGLWGAAFARKGELAKHRTRMVWACNLILLFVLAYALKMLFLGREDKSEWSSFYHAILYIHEFFVACMLAGGLYARVVAFKFAGSLFSENVPEVDRARRGAHARVGRLTLICTACALFTAGILLFGMFSRG